MQAAVIAVVVGEYGATKLSGASQDLRIAYALISPAILHCGQYVMAERPKGFHQLPWDIFVGINQGHDLILPAGIALSPGP
jgi:hypothetical protein